jgi:hypothetical protein
VEAKKAKRAKRAKRLRVFAFFASLGSSLQSPQLPMEQIFFSVSSSESDNTTETCNWNVNYERDL